jgi:hypothetical protein
VASSAPAADAIVVCQSGEHVAWVDTRGGGARVVLDGVPASTFDQVVDITFSPDGQRMAYVAVRSHDVLVVLDGEAGMPVANISRQIGLQFSPHGGHLIFGAVVNNRMARLVVDGVFIGNDDLAPVPPVFTRDGSRFAWVAEEKKLLSSKQWVVLDGRAGQRFDGIDRNGTLGFSPDGGHLAYAAKQGGAWHPVRDGEVGPGFDAVAPLVFNRDGSRLAHFAAKGRNAFVVVDGVAGPMFDRVDGVLFSPDGVRLTYAALAGTQSHAVVDDVLGPGCDELIAPAFSSDSRHVAYLAREGDIWREVVDGQFSAPFDDITPFKMLRESVLAGMPTFVAAEGDAHPTFAARRGPLWAMCRGGQPGRSYDDISTWELSPNGRRLAVAARLGDHWHTVIDEQEGPAFQSILSAAGLLFTPDGSHVAFVATRDGLRPCLDADVGTAFDWIGPPDFLSDDAVRWWCLRGSELVHVTWRR